MWDSSLSEKGAVLVEITVSCGGRGEREDGEGVGSVCVYV